MDSEQTGRKIEEILRREFSPSEFELEDQSYMHAGHKAAGGGGHFFVAMKSKRFNGLSPLARQRLVLDSVRGMMDKEIHALSMKCLPEG
jgi:BolA protein